MFFFLSDLSSVCVHGLFFSFGLEHVFFPPKIPLSAVGGGVGAVSQWGGDGTLSVACVLFF